MKKFILAIALVATAAIAFQNNGHAGNHKPCDRATGEDCFNATAPCDKATGEGCD